jgi:hypothetical protein
MSPNNAMPLLRAQSAEFVRIEDELRDQKEV